MSSVQDYFTMKELFAVIGIVKLIISGFIGAGIAYIFNFNLQKRVAIWKETVEEEKLAFLYFVRVNYLVSLFNLVKKVPGIFFKDEMSKMQKSTAYDLSHMISVIISEGLKDPIKAGGFKNHLEIFKNLDLYFEDILNIELKEEFLLKFSRDTIVTYQKFRFYLISIKHTLIHFVSCIEANLPMESKQIHSVWKNLISLKSYADKLRSVLIIRSKISNQAVVSISISQEKEMLGNFIANLRDEIKIAEAYREYESQKKDNIAS